MTNDKDGACPCWGTDKEVEQLRAELEAAQHQNAQLMAALAEIAKGQGAFSRDPLTHASNTIEHLVDTATVALQGNSTVLRDLLADTIVLEDNVKTHLCCDNLARHERWIEELDSDITRLRALCGEGGAK